MMGEQHQLLDFSGAIYYDAEGRPPPRAAADLTLAAEQPAAASAIPLFPQLKLRVICAFSSIPFLNHLYSVITHR
jgi:hypothetical protein